MEEQILDDDTILDLMKKHRPATVGDLVDLLESLAPGKGDFERRVLALVKEGKIPVIASRWNISLKLFDKLTAFFKIARDNRYLREPVVKIYLSQLFFVVLAWPFLILQLDSPLSIFLRACILCVNFLFTPGFTCLLAWHPISSATLDFRELSRGRQGGNREEERDEISWLSRIGYAIVLSVCILITLGFFVAFSGLGFNLIALNVFTDAIFFGASVSLFTQIRKLQDPYRLI